MLKHFLQKIIVFICITIFIIGCSNSTKEKKTEESTNPKTETKDLSNPKTIYLDGIESIAELPNPKMFETVVTMKGDTKAKKYNYKANTNKELYYHNDISSTNIELIEYDKKKNEEKIIYTVERLFKTTL